MPSLFDRAIESLGRPGRDDDLPPPGVDAEARHWEGEDRGEGEDRAHVRRDADPAHVWSRDRFFKGDGSWTPCPPVIDVTGPPRFLCYGPGVPLEAGRWRVRISFELCPDAARRSYLVQFGAGADYTTVDSKAGQPGRRDIEIEHFMKEADIAYVRIWVARAAFHGELRFIEAMAKKIAISESRCV